MAWYKNDSTGDWTATDSSGKAIQNGLVADSHGLANVVNGKWDGTYANPNATQKQDTIAVYDPTADIKAMAEAQKKAALAGLEKSYNKSTSDLNTAKAQIEPTYYAQRNATSTDAQIAARNFAEYMANRGQNTNTGINGTMAQAQLADNVALQGNLGNLAKGEAGAYTQNAKDLTDLSSAYNSDQASVAAGIDASAMQSLITAQQQYNAAKLAQANTDRTYNYQVGRDTVTDTGKLADGTQTIAGMIASGQITGQNLQNDYQKLVNQGYPAEQAAKMAQAAADLQQTYAQTANVNKSTSLLGVKSSSGGGSGSSSSKADAMGTAMDYLNAMARGQVQDSNGNSVRADRNDILNWIQKASGELTSKGVNVNTLTSWADKTFQWER